MPERGERDDLLESLNRQRQSASQMDGFARGWEARAEKAERALDRLAVALERAEQERDEARMAADFHADAAAGWHERAEKAERALAEIVKFEGAVEGDESDQADALVEVSRIARAALRPSEEAGDES